MNKYLRLALSVAGFALFWYVYYYAFSGNGIFDRIYLSASYLQIIFVLVGLFALPYIVRDILRSALKLKKT